MDATKVCVAYVSTAEVWLDSAVDWTFHGLNKVSHSYPNCGLGAILPTCGLVMFGSSCHNRKYEYLRSSQHFGCCQSCRCHGFPGGLPAARIRDHRSVRHQVHRKQLSLRPQLSSANGVS